MIHHQIREATRADLEAIVLINTQCWQKNYHRIIAADYLASINYQDQLKRWQRYHQHAEQFDALFLVKTDWDQKILGYLLAQRNDQSEAIDHEIEIVQIYVDPEHQGKGIGKELFHALMQHPKYQKNQTFYLLTLKDNHRSCNFYQQLWGKAFITLPREIGGISYPLAGFFRERRKQ